MCQWLFYKYMLATKQTPISYFVVGSSSRYNIYCIYRLYQFVYIGIAGDLVLCNCSCSLCIIRVKKTNQLNSCNFLPLLHVNLTEVACTKYSNLKHRAAKW